MRDLESLSANKGEGADVIVDDALGREDAEAALAYLERYEYASLPHVTAALLWHTMMRMGVPHMLSTLRTTPQRINACRSSIGPIKERRSRTGLEESGESASPATCVCCSMTGSEIVGRTSPTTTAASRC
ncbi:MAG: hypothetical protein U5K37_06365 [Natrialbaceae archaeon]|nr:hypothetical protein [Natrialbaceae archaeon]